MIEVRNVTKSYGDLKVVDEVCIRIPKGKITSLIGPNGAGKSTLLAVISRLIPKDGGEVYIDQIELSDWDNRELAKKISILKQTNHTDLRLTIRELVSFGRFPHCRGNLTKADWDQVDLAISYMGLADIQDKYLDQLSGGQRQRAYIAMVIAQDTEYILLDEPLNNLDMKHSVEIMKMLRRLVEDLGKTVIIVIHDINFASCYSDFIIAMNNGAVVKVGTAKEIIDRSLLTDIYDLDFHIETVNNNRICIYY